MSKDIEKYRIWVRQGQHSCSAAFYYLSKAILEELGEEKGTEIIIKQIKERGKASGLKRRKILENKSLDNSLKNYSASAKTFSNRVSFAWESEIMKATPDARAPRTCLSEMRLIEEFHYIR